MINDVLLKPTILGVGFSIYILFFYFTLIFFPARILLPEILFSFLSFFTVVPLRAAISESVSPLLMVMLLPLEFFLLPFLLRLLREDLLRLLREDDTLLRERLLRERL